MSVFAFTEKNFSISKKHRLNGLPALAEIPYIFYLVATRIMWARIGESVHASGIQDNRRIHTILIPKQQEFNYIKSLILLRQL